MSDLGEWDCSGGALTCQKRAIHGIGRRVARSEGPIRSIVPRVHSQRAHPSTREEGGGRRGRCLEAKAERAVGHVVLRMRCRTRRLLLLLPVPSTLELFPNKVLHLPPPFDGERRRLGLQQALQGSGRECATDFLPDRRGTSTCRSSSSDVSSGLRQPAKGAGVAMYENSRSA